MAKLQRKAISSPDEVRSVPGGSIELFELGDAVAARTTFEPSFRWSVSMKPLYGTEDRPFHHRGYSISGRLRVQMRDGAELEIGPHQFYEIPPNHDAWVVGDEPMVMIDWGPSATVGLGEAPGGQRSVSTILFTDIVGSTATAGRLGDGRWRDLLSEHDRVVRTQLDRYRGREIVTTGDGFLCLFDSADRAVRAALAMVAAAHGVGAEIRAGIHTGEVELESGNVRGLAVHVASRILGLAAPGEVMVSWTTRDLLHGSPLRFVDRGMHELKGVAEPRAAFSVELPAT